MNKILLPVCNVVCDFLSSLPEPLQTPNFLLEPGEQVCLEWYKGDGEFISISVDGDSFLYYAYQKKFNGKPTIGVSHNAGKFYFDKEIGCPDKLLNLITFFTPNK